jgi:molybdenum cofactor biosynthesis protein B
MHRHDHHHTDKTAISTVVVTVSDTRTIADDESGAVITELLRAHRHEVARREIVTDDRHAIEGVLRRAIADDVQLVVLTGGTGIAPRDVTYEVVASMLDKTLDGFGEAFRRLSWDEIGAKSILSRTVAGAAGRTLVVALPGSAKAVRLGMEKVLLPIVAHAVGLLRA